ncbi:hypothetical protein AURDEDRAFT_131424 [Auricularia subglabra TFB-10046 SS5]|uniref:Restriction of telomere capping protein 4 n=1 Tax=Auricularia subglabra (strain TFB-10046 / SS5) TaxID=717982 RepID=J0WNL5_AURST|nr:hypothetical protein AURDEDRAFT_131424 [Auricularia subglabra TFB-10046 SS5]
MPAHRAERKGRASVPITRPEYLRLESTSSQSGAGCGPHARGKSVVIDIPDSDSDAPLATSKRLESTSSQVGARCSRHARGKRVVIDIPDSDSDVQLATSSFLPPNLEGRPEETTARARSRSLAAKDNIIVISSDSEDDPSLVQPIPDTSRKSPNFPGHSAATSEETMLEHLCPFCDAVLPVCLSPRLERLLSNALSKSQPRPTARNPKARKARHIDRAGVCERHKLETRWVPKALRKGWPLELHLDSIARRVLQLEPALNVFICDPLSSRFFVKEAYRRFSMGLRAAESARGQYASGSDASMQPGYYGEQGGLEIHRLLCSMYLGGELVRLQEARNAYKPLSTSDFLYYALVPECALMLMMADHHVDAGGARKILSESSKYGSLMFADDEILSDTE